MITTAGYEKVLTALATHVIEHGTFPPRERFRANLGPNVRAFDELEAKQELARWSSRSVWRLNALKRIAGNVEFAQAEIDRARAALEELIRMYPEALAEHRSVADLNDQLGWTDLNQVRRALLLLQPLGAFDDFGVWLDGAQDKFQISGSVLTLVVDDIFRPAEPPSSGEPLPIASSHGELARMACDLFEKAFAGPYRAGQDRQLAPKAPRDRPLYDLLARRGLIDRAHGQPGFRLSDGGKEASFDQEILCRSLDLPAPVKTEPDAVAGAMHRLIDHLDDLDGLADALFALLRAARRQGKIPNAGRPALESTSEFQKLEDALRSGCANAALGSACLVLEGVPGLAAAHDLVARAAPSGLP